MPCPGGGGGEACQDTFSGVRSSRGVAPGSGELCSWPLGELRPAFSTSWSGGTCEVQPAPNPALWYNDDLGVKAFSAVYCYVAVLMGNASTSLWSWSWSLS
jgi:hypothetical protein